MSPKEAKNILFRMAANFPGLVDGEQDVNGADLVDWIAAEFYYFTGPNPKHELINRAKNGTPDEESK